MKRIAYLLPLAVAGMLLALHAQEQPAPAAPPAEAAPAEPTAPAPVESEPAPVVDTATPTPAPADPGPPNIGAYALDEMEVVKREEDLIKADALVGDGYRFLNAGEADKALERFNVARKLIGQPSPATQQSYANLVNGIAVAYTFKAEGAINAGDMAQAQNFADEALKADPENAAAKKMAERVGRDTRLAASKVEKPKDMNPALTPEFLKSQNDVGILFKNGDDYFNTGQFEKALDSYKAILLKDPDNLAAARRIERVYDRKMKTANAGKEIVDKRGAWQVRDKWSEDMRRGSKDGVPEAVIADVQDRASMLDKKLDKIIIPQIKLTDSELSAAINYLGNLSRVLDAEEADPKRKGVNMVIQLNQATSEDPAAAAGEFKPNPVNLELSNVSLRDALRFVTEAANVSFRVDPVAIVIVPPGLGKQLLTKKFRTPAGFFQTEISPTTATGAGGGRSQLTGGQNIGKANVKDALEAKGVDFKTPGSNAFLIGANTLIVKNTSENLDFVEELVRVEDEY
ncbi:MAG: hypothetical protein SFY92_02750, partial [Verrucomicrobiae bacterium]|nr:hypothetical protein [Verrucomicrobiae bacterium]